MATLQIKTGTSAATVNALIENAAPGDVVTFAAGVHIFDETIVIRRDDITVKGVGEQKTQIKFRFDDNGDGVIDRGEGGSGFEILGFAETSNFVRKKERGEVTQAVDAGQRVFTASDVDDLAVGDVVHLSQQNTAAYLEEVGGCAPGTPCFDTALNRSFREFTSTVAAVDQSTGRVTLADPLPYDLSPGDSRVIIEELTEVRREVSLSDFTLTFEILDPITGKLIRPDANAFENTQEGFLEGARPSKAGVYVEGSTGVEIKNISVINAPSDGFLFRNSINADADNLLVSGSFNKGIGGNGYGVNIYETSNSSFTNLEVYDVRHAVLFSAWNAETGNAVQIDNTNRDINFHGSPDLGNAVTVDRANLKYGDSAEIWKIVSNGGRIVHQQTDIYGLGNTVVFDVAAGSARDELIFASDNGAWLHGRQGDDILVAGEGADELRGGGGSDGVSYQQSTSRIWVDLRGNMESQHGAAGDRLFNIENVSGSAFNDLILADGKNNTLEGQAGNDTIYAREGADVVRGGAGNDKLHGQRGNDVLSGGAGSDVFYFDDGDGRDQVTDFQIGSDRLDFSRVGPVSDLGDLVISDGSGGAVVRYVGDGGAVAEVVLRGVGARDLGLSDFLF